MTNIDLRDALKRAASALKADGPEFALAGSYALWAYGGPEPVHDVDFVVAEEDTEAAALTLEKAGFRSTARRRTGCSRRASSSSSSSTCYISSTGYR